MDTRHDMTDEADEESNSTRYLMTTEIPADDVPELRVEFSKIAQAAFIYAASYSSDLIILHCAPESMQHVMTWCRDNYVGLEPLLGAATVSGYKALDYIRTVNLPLNILNVATRLAQDVIYAEATGAIYSAINHCLLGREASIPERAAWNVAGPALLRSVKDCAYNAWKRGTLFGPKVSMHVGSGFADYTIILRGYALKPMASPNMPSSDGRDRQYHRVGDGSSRSPLMMTEAVLGGSTDAPTARRNGPG
jgi:hypothetical protein